MNKNILLTRSDLKNINKINSILFNPDDPYFEENQYKGSLYDLLNQTKGEDCPVNFNDITIPHYLLNIFYEFCKLEFYDIYKNESIGDYPGSIIQTDLLKQCVLENERYYQNVDLISNQTKLMKGQYITNVFMCIIAFTPIFKILIDIFDNVKNAF